MATNIALMITAIGLFAVLHSLTAGQRTRRWFAQSFGERACEGLYRLLYNIFSVVTLVPVFVLLLRDREPIYSVGPPVDFVLMAIQAVGLIGLLIAILQIDLLRFAGIHQFVAYVTGGELPLPAETLHFGGVYAFTRHPLYLFSLLLIWPSPSMTATMLAFNIGATLYFIVGSLIEEQRMLKRFGEPYAAYRRRVPWLIPYPRRKNRTAV